METKSDDRKRLHELDWLRTGAIALVVLYHTGMLFVSWGFHLKAPVVVGELEPIMVWMHQWRMPLLLFVSGIGTFFLLQRHGLGRFVWERQKRLLIPALFGMLVIVPPQIYVERAAEYRSFWEFYPSVFAFVPYPQGSFSWHHLWFVVYLFCFSVVGLPLFAFLRSDRSLRFREAAGRILTRRALLVIGLVPLLASETALRRHFPEDTHALVDDWARFMTYLLYFISGYVLFSLPGVWDAIRRDRWIYTTLAGMAALCLELAFMGKLGPLHVFNYNYEWIVFPLAVGWFTILALVGWAQVGLRRKSERLKRWNEGSYPVYILHQTLLLVGAYWGFDFNWPWWIQFLLLFAFSLVGSWLCYDLLIRKVSFLRLLFGLKLRANAPRLGEAQVGLAIAREKETAELG